ncbi:hypothetical protein [Candidatus Palauibacter sp.]|uniref:hypothetical protein n=1 Tax=Candidatus Palauibacter sp. TaxID=3101350 RepID=UPI003B02D97B
MTSGSPGSPVSAARGAASIGLLLGLFAAAGCRESTVAPGVPESNVVVADGRNRGDDPYVVISKTFRESDPVQLPALLAHDANGDSCDAWLTESLVFDLALVRTRYQQFYGPGSGKVVLRIAGVSGDDLVYEFAG